MPIKKRKIVVPSKKTAPEKPQTGTDTEQLEVFTNLITGAIKDGELDFMISDLNKALVDRVVAFEEEKAASASASASKKPSAKRVPVPPKKTSAETETSDKPAKTLKLIPEKNYRIGKKPAALAGVKVKFIKDSPKSEEKAVVEIVDEKPGYPSGKRVIIAKSALVSRAR